MEEIFIHLLESGNKDVYLLILALIVLGYISITYLYKILKLNKRSNLEELRIKNDIIKSIDAEKNR